MKTVCLIDTTVFCKLLINRDQAVVSELQGKIEAGERLFLPMATVIETGNHIGQIGNGNQRRRRAEEFVKQVALAIEGKSPFTPIDFLEANKMQRWLDEFPAWAMRGSGLGDLSIMHDWQRLCDQNRGRRVYIWSFDQHLRSYDREAKL